VLHEKKGGYANNIRAVRGLAAKAEAEGARIATGVRVTGIRLAGGAVTAVETDQGTVTCDHLVVAVGPWIRDLWAWLDLPETITVAGPGGTGTDRPMWTYWALQEGTLGIEPKEFTDNRGDFPPVTHVDSAEPLIDDVTGDLITDKLWGIYYKPDFNFAGLQGGAARTSSTSPPVSSPSTRTARRAPSTRWPTTSSGCGRRGWRTATSGSRASGTCTSMSAAAESAPSRRTASRSSAPSGRTPT
jgi:Glycine/D-amino acid oxidases (deaminating)